MKKITIVSLVVLMSLFCASLSHAYTFNDPVGLAYPAPGYDRIGNRIFELYGMNVTEVGDSLVFDIFTNYKEVGYRVSNWYTKPADFAIDLNGDFVYEYGVSFSNRGSIVKGGIYSVDSWYVSDHFAPPGGYVYNHNRVVQIANGTLVDNTVVTWNTDVGNPDWRINFALDKSDIFENLHGQKLNFFFGTATCSNDFIEGSFAVTPEPATLSLLGLGLFGLMGFRKKEMK